MKFYFSFCLFLLCTFSFTAQENKNVSFKTSDSIKISASFLFPEKQKKQYPAIILIHQGGSSKKEWLDLPLINLLLKNKYALLIYDIRQHGESEKDKGSLNDLFNNPKRAPLDLLAAIQFLKSDERINKNKIGILGASIGANLACIASNSDAYSIKSIVSISAKTDAVINLSGKKTNLNLKNAYYIASKEEQGGKREKWAKELYSKTHKKRKVEIAKGNKHGSYILRNNLQLQNSILNWFKKTL